MTNLETVQRVRIYLGQADTYQGNALYLVVLDRLRRDGATGASALRGLAGFGPGYRLRLDGPARLDANPPVVIEWVDRTERIGRLLPQLDELLADNLVTIEAVQVYRAVLHASGPLGTAITVGDMMHEVPTLGADAPLTEALALMLDQGLDALPVLDAQRRLQGLLDERQLARRGGLGLPLRLLRRLDPAERAALLAPLDAHSLAELMNSEPPSFVLATPIVEALVSMVEWGHNQLVIVDRDGRFQGLLDTNDVLRAAADSAAPAAGVRDTEPPAPVSLIMQTITPQISSEATLAVALEHVLLASDRQLAVVAADRQLVGVISELGALARLKGEERAALLAAMRRDTPTPATALPGGGRSLAEIVERDVATLAPSENIADATRALLDHNIERMLVVDPDGKLVGALTRGALLRAFLQQQEYI